MPSSAGKKKRRDARRRAYPERDQNDGDAAPPEPASVVTLRCSFLFDDSATAVIYALSLHDALPISARCSTAAAPAQAGSGRRLPGSARRSLRSVHFERSEEHTSELQSLAYLVCRLLLEKKNGAMLGAERILSEIKTTATLHHPNLLPLLHSGVAFCLMIRRLP